MKKIHEVLTRLNLLSCCQSKASSKVQGHWTPGVVCRGQWQGRAVAAQSNSQWHSMLCVWSLRLQCCYLFGEASRHDDNELLYTVYFSIWLWRFLMRLYSLALWGVARGESKDAIPFILERDSDLICLTSSEGKRLACLSDLACSIAQKHGITELTVTDHALTPLVQEIFFDT